MRVLDLFSGIGGFSLGLERAGGFETVAFCEIDPYCQLVLARHWPGVPCYDDIRTLRLPTGFADVICGGFPCQPFSSAARGRNRDGNLWPEMCRIISEIQSTWVIAENVVNFDRMALCEMVADLEEIGYEVAPPLEIPACAVGHDHWRPRLWILGHSNRNRKPVFPIDAEMAKLPQIVNDAGRMGENNGVPKRVDRLRALGNAVVPQIPELIGKAILAAEER